MPVGHALRPLLAGLIAVVLAWCGPAMAHPHVFVTATATVNVEKGALTSITHTWTFDEYYTSMALEGIAKNAAGGYGRAELADLTKVNIEGLKEFDYFTYARLGQTELKVGDPKLEDSYLEYNNGVLALHFTVPLLAPVPMEAKGFALTITDPSYFIAFELSEKDPPKLNADAPKSCKIEVAAPPDETADEKKLTGAFAEQMAPAMSGMGGVVKAILVSCAPQ